MGCERHRRSNVVLNLTPLIDIVFLLLVFFMLTAHFIEDESISIDLPEAVSSKKADDEGFIEVAVTPDGKILVSGSLVEPEHLRQTLSGALHAPGKRFVRLRGDHQAHFGLGVQVIDAARQAGAESLDILTEKP